MFRELVGNLKHGVMATEIAKAGVIHVDTVTGHLVVHDGITRGGNLIGGSAQGPTGPTGPMGIVGATGPTGPHAAASTTSDPFVVLLTNDTPLTNFVYNNGNNGVGATLTGTANGVLVLDGANVLPDSVVLIGGDQSQQIYNGIYDVTNPGDDNTPWLLTRNVNAQYGWQFGLITVMTSDWGGHLWATAFIYDNYYSPQVPNIGVDTIGFLLHGITGAASGGIQLGGWDTFGENTFVGQLSGSYMYFNGLMANAPYGIHNTAFGLHAIGYDITCSYTTAVGNDCMRNLVASNGGGFNTAVGKGAMYMGGGSHNTAMGFWALGGTAGTINIAGSPTTGDIINVTFTGQFTGSPHTVSYTVPAASTLASIATGLAAAFHADSTIAPKLTSNTCVVIDNTNVQPWFAGTALTGTANGSDGISMTTSVTGAGTEILTVSNGSDGIYNVALGDSAMPGYYITTASYNFAAMDESLHFLTSGSYNIAIGGHAGYKISSGSNNILLGNNNGMALTLGSNNTIIGVNQASAMLSTGSGNLYLAAGSPSSSTIDAATAGESNTFRLGNNAVNVMRATGINTSTPKFFLDWFPTSTSYANDAAAATGGVSIGQIYRNGSVMMTRVA